MTNHCLIASYSESNYSFSLFSFDYEDYGYQTSNLVKVSLNCSIL